jgi:sugar phosphate isomerase/epimerase
VSLRYGYGTNGFQSHRLEDALAVIAGLGYDGVALTLDHLHLDPFAPGLPARTAAVRQRLDELGLAVVVETGARYLLDPLVKHHPTLLSEGSDRRIDYLRRAVEVAADLGAEATSFWSGARPAQVDDETCWTRLADGVGEVLDLADRRGVTLAFEPEPGMFVDTLDDVLELRRRMGDPHRLRVTLDVGHIVCNEPRGVADTVRAAGDLIANVQVDDMVRGVHEHLELGVGEVDFVAALGALRAVGYRGLAALELPRHGHVAPAVAERSLAFLRAAEARTTEALATDARTTEARTTEALATEARTTEALTTEAGW